MLQCKFIVLTIRVVIYNCDFQPSLTYKVQLNNLKMRKNFTLIIILLLIGFLYSNNIFSQNCPWIEYNYSNFDSASSIWIDGGSDCEYHHPWIFGGTTIRRIRLRDDSGIASSLYTQPLNFAGISSVQFDFMLNFQSMEYGEDLYLEYALDGSSDFRTAHQWIRGQNIENSYAYSRQVIQIDDNFSDQTVFRFRCDASDNYDYVHLDDVRILTCQSATNYTSQRPIYRTLDGTMNNPEHPEWGSTGIPLLREIPADYSDGQSSLAGENRPSPRHISNQLSDEVQDRRDQRLLSGMTYQFGQFLDHDIVISEPGDEPAPIDVPDYDPIFKEDIPFTRSAALEGSSPRDQVNQNTSYIDASQIYGSDEERATWLRSFQDGKLRVSAGNLLPYNTTDGEFDSPTDPSAPMMERNIDRNGNLITLAVAGDIRANEHPNLTALHTVFVREHNRLCDYLISTGESDDEIIYQKARKLLGAMMQQIVYTEFLPSLGVHLSPYIGYRPSIRPDVRNTFTTAAYRWHTMVENDIILRNDNCEGIGPVELPLKTIFANPSIIRKFGPGVLLRGLSFHPQYRTDLKVNNGLRNFLFGQGAGLDLVSINLQRGRDHGLPDYKTIREFYGLSRISDFDDINDDDDIDDKLESVYNNVNDIDLWVGIFAEPLVSGTSLPATAIAIIKQQFEALRDGDFYFYQNDPALSFSDKSIISNSSLANIIERNTSARNMPSNIFFKPPCDDSDPLEDLNDHDGKRVCRGSGASFMTSCANSNGYQLYSGAYTYPWLSDITKIKIQLGFGVRIYNASGETALYTDDTGCLPDKWRNRITAVDVICLSNDPSTIDCTGFAGALFTECFGSPHPIFTAGLYNTEQLRSLSIKDNDIEGIRVNNGFKITLYTGDDFQGIQAEYYGPTVLCLPSSLANKISSIRATCISQPDLSNCGFNGVAGGVFPDDDDDKSHLGVSVGPGDYDSDRLIAIGVGDNNIEGVKVNNGYAITLFDNSDFTGTSITFLGDDSDLGSSPPLESLNLFEIWQLLVGNLNSSSLKNKTSSMTVRCIESLQRATAPRSVINFTASAASDMAKLDITYNLTKEAIYQRIEKYNGKIGDFERIAEFPIEDSQASHTYYDENTIAGDNVYRVKVIYIDGTEQETNYRTVRFDKTSPINIYPNPAVDRVTIHLGKYLGKNVNVGIYDARGMEVVTQKFTNLSTPEVLFDLTNTIGGIYFAKVISDDGIKAIKKFTIVKEY